MINIALERLVFLRESLRHLPPRPSGKPQPRRRLRLRREYLRLILAVVLVTWMLTAVQPAFTWSEVMNVVGVRDQEMYARRGVLGLILIGVVWMRRVLRDEEKDR